ncbi:MAG TPA: hypothetical protein DEQ34_14550 [Balneolaceae bacterium]|mgnify:CR=1 FL=1|nr:hypothetical protein [Balneolaceae bacterium]
MHTFYLILGITIIVVIAYDFFYTTLSFNGAGYLSRLTSRFLSSLFLFLNRYVPRRNALRYSGVTHILFLLGMWIGLLWIGFFLLLMSDPGSVVEEGTGSAASALTKMYVSGYTLSTLGVGDYVPGSEGWQIIMAAFSFAGFIFITTAMTYLMSLTTAVIHKRNLSLFIANMGDSPEELAASFYDGEHFSILTDISARLREMINKHNQNHYAHPAVHYFYSTARDESLSINLVNVDEALTILTHHVESKTWRVQDIRPLRDAITKFLDTASHHYQQKNFEITHSTPHLQYLKSNKIPLVQKSAISSCQKEIHERRCSLNGLLQSNGWSWNDIYPKQQITNSD